MKILLVSFSHHFCYQECVCSMVREINRNNTIEAKGMISKKNDGYGNEENIYQVNVPKKNGLCFGLFNFINILKIKKIIKKEKFDLIYFESVHFWNILFQKKYNSKAVISIHDIIPHNNGFGSFLLQLFYKITIKNCDKIIVRNQKQNSKLIQNEKDKGRVEYLPLWYDFKDLVLNEKKGNVLFFGRLNRYKGIDNVVKIARKLDMINFIIAGNPEKDVKKELDDIAKIKNVKLIAKSISSVEKNRLFNDSDCVILPYNSATQSGVIIDSYKFSLPVLVFDVGALSEQIQDNYSGYIIKPGDIDAFCDKIKYIEKMDEMDYYKLRSNAFNFGVQHYSTFSVYKKFISIIEEALS